MADVTINRVKDRLSRGEFVTGALATTPSSAMVQTVAAAGFDYIVIDQMYGSISWHDAADMARAAKLSGISPIMRLQAEPWAVFDNQQVAVDADRALSVGCDGILFSVTTADEVRRVVDVVNRSWHRDLQATPWTREDFENHLSKLRAQTFVALLVESRTAYDNIEEIASVPGVDAIFVATTDLSIEFTGGVNSESPETWQAVDRLATVCSDRGLSLWANTGMGFSTFPEMNDRALRLVDHGAKMILFQMVELLLQMSATHVQREFLAGLASRTSTA